MRRNSDSQKITDPLQPVECVFWGPEASAKQLVDSASIFGLRIHVAANEEDVRCLMALLSCRVLLAQWDSRQPAHLAALHALTQFGRGAAWIAWLPVFDSREWVHCLESGAFDLVTADDSPECVARVIRHAEEHFLRSRTDQPQTGRLRRWFRFGALTIFQGR